LSFDHSVLKAETTAVYSSGYRRLLSLYVLLATRGLDYVGLTQKHCNLAMLFLRSHKECGIFFTPIDILEFSQTKQTAIFCIALIGIQ